jgi:hypothetical protein
MLAGSAVGAGTLELDPDQNASLAFLGVIDPAQVATTTPTATATGPRGA